jgi:hypothetical protein
MCCIVEWWRVHGAHGCVLDPISTSTISPKFCRSERYKILFTDNILLPPLLEIKYDSQPCSNRKVKANSHMPRSCCSPAMLPPCRSPAMPCRWGFRLCLSHLIYTVRPCLIHICHATTMPFWKWLLKATAWHGYGMKYKLASAVQRRHMGNLTTFGFFGYHADFYEGCYQKHTNLLNCRTSSLIFQATSQTFTKDTALSEVGRGAARYTWINVAWHGMACVN